MFTHPYKTGFIHGYCDRAECTAQLGTATYQCTSYRAAQLLIARLIKVQRLSAWRN